MVGILFARDFFFLFIWREDEGKKCEPTYAGAKKSSKYHVRKAARMNLAHEIIHRWPKKNLFPFGFIVNSAQHRKFEPRISNIINSNNKKYCVLNH